jgi:outer membrane protein OmpA-like peptidoglycan-associated protein
MRKTLLGLVCFCCIWTVNAQNGEKNIKRGTLAVQVGAYDFGTAQAIRSGSLNSVLGNKQWTDFRQMDMAFGLSYIKGISEHLDYSVNGYFGSVKYPVRQSNGSAITGSNNLLFETDASLHLKLLTDNFIVVPYLSAGLGGSVWNGRFEAFSPIGGGLQFGLGQDYFAFSNFQYRVPVTQGANYHFLYGIGIGGPVGKPREVEVKPAPVAPIAAPVVVAPTPPADTDGDKIIDSEDKCPTVPGVAKYQGCPIPDTDRDGINDEEDKCPTVPGIAKYQGCPIPDTDRDGINDEQDKCPTVAGLARYQGCPIPDTDGDSVNDEEDKCPTVAGLVELRGCPRPDFKGENVLFATGNATLVVSGKKELEKLVPYLNEFADVKVTIAGHTDNTGSAALNQKLSENRAKAAKAYLVSKGIDAERMKTEGFGSTKPIADNKTAAGRKLNRRVEFTVDN